LGRRQWQASRRDALAYFQTNYGRRFGAARIIETAKTAVASGAFAYPNPRDINASFRESLYPDPGTPAFAPLNQEAA
jgi:hypothetical protein